MQSKNITLRVNSELYDKYKALCKKKDYYFLDNLKF